MFGKLTPSQPFTSAVKDACIQSLSSSSLSSSSTSSSLSLSLLSLMLLLLFRSCTGIVLCVCFLCLMVFQFAYSTIRRCIVLLLAVVGNSLNSFPSILANNNIIYTCIATCVHLFMPYISVYPYIVLCMFNNTWCLQYNVDAKKWCFGTCPWDPWDWYISLHLP